VKYGKQVKTLDVQELMHQLSSRVRKDYGEKELRDLATSMEQLGQIQPIVLQREKDNLQVRVGGRRIMAAVWLGSQDPPRTIRGLEVGQIRAVMWDGLSRYEQLLVEFDENVHRKGFTNAEEAIAIANLKAAFEEETGKGMPKGQLANLLNYSRGQISMALAVAEGAKQGKVDPKKETSIAGAYKKLKSAEKIADLIKRANAQEGQHDARKELGERLHLGDAIEWIKIVPDESIDFVHYDPPWGIGIDKYDRNTHYGEFDDSAETGIVLAKGLVPELYRVMRQDTYGVAWFGIQYYQFLAETLTDAGFAVQPVPFIWYKSDKRGAQNDPTRATLNVYEPFFLFAKGEPRMFKQAQINVLEFPMPESRVHFAQKNTEMLVDILERFSFGAMTVLDPTFGSGSVFAACERLGRNYIGCEKDKDNYEKAIRLIRSRRHSE
jgi:DNA modification methylase